jgi:hypothetical protein
MSFAEFQKLALQFTNEIRKLAREELMDDLKARGVFGGGSKRAWKKLGSVARGKPVAGGGKPCRVPGCGKISKGPRFDFFCEVHRTMSKKAKAAIKNGEQLPKKPAPKKKAKAPKVVAKAPKVVVKPQEPVTTAPKNGNGNGETAKLVKVDGKQKIAYQGIVLTPREWSKKLGLNAEAVRHRLRRGATAMEAITVKA